MRRTNRSSILELLRQESPISRSEIAKRVGMSLPTVMRVVDELVAEDLVRPAGKANGRMGRPRSLLEFTGHTYAVVGVDLGGAKIFGTVADLAGTIQYETYMQYNTTDRTDALDRLWEMIEQLFAAPRPNGQRILGIGVGVAGLTLNPNGIVVWAPSLGWRDLPLRDLIAKRFQVPVIVENDVNLAALGEWGFGAGRGAPSLVCVAVGTGIGAGVVINGMLYRGYHQYAGEIGYVLPGTEFLGRRYDQYGALEEVASGRAIAVRARRVFDQQGWTLPVADLTAEYVFASARRGEAWAQQVVSETVDHLAVAIANISALLDPAIVILSGGVAKSADLLIGPILQRLDGILPYTPQLVASSLGYRAVTMGATMVVLNATMDYMVLQKMP